VFSGLSASQAETVQSSTALPCHHEFKNLGTQHCWRARAPEKKNELSRRKPFGVGSGRFRFEAQLASFNSSNIRKERVKGLLLMAASLPGFFYILQVSDQHSWQTFTRTGLAVIGLLYLSSVNLFVLGLMLLLAGLKGLSVLGERRLKRGLWIKLIGANLLAIVVPLVNLEDEGAFGTEFKDSWLALPVLVLLVFFARKGINFIRTGWKYEVVSAEEVLKKDPRPPVVYIRSFKDDQALTPDVNRSSKWFPRLLTKWFSRLLTWTVAVSIEQELAFIMNRVGPVVAIGKPGEQLPELGAARLYARDDEWQVKITDLMRRSRLVVIRGGTTANLWWEIEQAAKLLPLRKLLIVSIGKSEEASEFNRGIEQRFGQPANPHSDGMMASPFFWHERELGRIAYFNEGGRLFVIPILWRISLKGFLLVAFRPTQDALESAFWKVFHQLDLPWTAPPSRAMAILVALLERSFGVQYFRAGQIRKGVLTILFLWTGVPFILGIVDAVKLALTDEEESSLPSKR